MFQYFESSASLQFVKLHAQIWEDFQVYNIFQVSFKKNFLLKCLIKLGNIQVVFTTVNFSLSVNINLELAIYSIAQNQVNIKCAIFSCVRSHLDSAL